MVKTIIVDMKHFKSPLILSLLILSLVSCGGTPASSSSQVPSSQESAPSSSSSKEATSSAPSSSSSDKATSKEESSSSEQTSEKESSVEPSSSSQPAYKLDPTKESLYAKQTYLNFVGNIQNVWDSYRGDGVTLAVIDSGFHVDHPEFYFDDGTSKILESSASFAYDGSKVAVKQGKSNVEITDGDSHGTICATVAAGSCTGEGTVGIAPNCNLMLLKTDKKPKSIEAAFRYAADNGARVITISIGSYYDYDGDLVRDGSDLATVFNPALKYVHSKGVVVCSAAGNGGECGKPTEFTFPGGSDYVIGAGGLASSSRTSIWSGSSYNSGKSYQFCDVFAPAQGLYSGCYFDRDGKHYDYDGGFNGTSFASPILAGAACLYFQKNPTATNVDFERALFRSATALLGEKGGYGAIHIENLMNYQKPSNAEKTFYFTDASWWRADGANTSVFAWNYAQTSINADYPGALMQKASGNNNWSITLDTSIFERLVFVRVSPRNEDWGAETVNIDISSFGTKNCYSIASTSAAWKDQGNYVKGTFTNVNG